jgi:hypothetical protein
MRHITFVKQIPNEDKNLLALLPSVDTSNVSIGAVTAIYCASSGRHPVNQAGQRLKKQRSNVKTQPMFMYSLLRKIEWMLVGYLRK